MSSKKYDYDVLYIGSGHACFDGAIPLASKGVKVGIIEKGTIGGTCPNRGCNAKITLDAPVNLKRAFQRLNGIVSGNLKINWNKNFQHKEEVIKGLPDFISGSLKSANVDVIHGNGILKDSHTVEINEKETKTADKIVIGTGQHPHRLDIPGEDLAGDSSDFMNLKKLPKHILILGAGYVAMEFATIANASGADVTVLTHGNKALRAYHQEFVETIIQDLEKRGVKFVRKTEPKAFSKKDDKLNVETKDGNNFECDWILDATGRVPNVKNIGLEKVGIDYNPHGIVVNDHLQTNVSNIYASGDVIDKKQPKLTPTAIFESLYLTQSFLHENTQPIDYPAIPSVVFTSPRISQVGISYQTAKNNPSKFKIENGNLEGDWFRQVEKETIDNYYLIFDKNENLVGASEVSERAVNVINTLLPAIEFKLNKKQIGRLIYLFPSIESATNDLL